MDECRKHRLGQVDAILHQHLSHIQIGPRLERHGERITAVVAALGRHVHHVLDTIDLLFDRSGNRIGDHSASWHPGKYRKLQP